MARRVRTAFRKLRKRRPDLHAFLKETRGMTSTRALNRLRRKRVKPIISSSKLRSMAQKASKRSGVPIKISKDMTEGSRYADGVAIQRDSDVRVRLHPVLKYYDKRHISDVIGHELDHAKVMKRAIKRKSK